ncbi:MAG: hypothetical protein KC418_23505 [Anaerolineales bacterium]|nr:hypothetical protein [Anaerolineales bacterium]
MGPETAQVFDFILRALDTVGTLGLLVVAVVMFYRGEILPKSTVNKMLEESREQVKALAQEIIKGMDSLEEPIVRAVHDAVRNALLEFGDRDLPQKRNNRGQFG